MEYMHRNPPPPLGLVNNSDFSHQNVTRNASAPDSIRQWGSNCNPTQGLNQAPVTMVEPLGLAIGQAVPHSQMESSPRSPMQRLNSTSDSQLNRAMSSVNRALSSDPFSSTETWKYKFDAGISPLLGTSMTPSASIWGAPPSPPQLATPPPSPSRNSNLGPVGSRPSKGPENRRDLHYHLCRIFPSNHVEHVMKMMPDETDPKVLCAKILEML